MVSVRVKVFFKFIVRGQSATLSRDLGGFSKVNHLKSDLEDEYQAAVKYLKLEKMPYSLESAVEGARVLMAYVDRDGDEMSITDMYELDNAFFGAYRRERLRLIITIV